MFLSISVESAHFSMVTALPLTSLAKIEHGGHQILRGCRVRKSRDRQNENTIQKWGYQDSGAQDLHEVIETVWKAKQSVTSFLDWVMKHFIHMIFFFCIKNPLHQKEGKEPDVGSQKSSLTARDSCKSRNSRISVLQQMPVPLSLYHDFYLWPGILLF